MQPRIYIYKVTFEEIPDWYWGAHKESEFDDGYLGSPTTHAWKWEFYTPYLQICEVFPYTDEGWKEACDTENRCIKPDLNNPLCLNEHYGGFMSLEVCRQAGRTGGNSCLEKQVGWHDPEVKSDAGKKGGATNAKNKTGVCGIAIDERRENGRKGGITAFEESVGVFAPENLGKGGRNVSKDDCIARGKKAAETNRQNRTAFFDPAIQKQGTTAAHSKKDDEGKSIHAKKVGKIAFSQKWMDPDHPELGAHNAGNLVRVQKAKGLPHGKENRRRVG
jgi:hypothetical protein